MAKFVLAIDTAVMVSADSLEEAVTMAAEIITEELDRGDITFDLLDIREEEAA